MDNCIFCKIASGQIPTDAVYQDDELIVFRDIRPKAPVHLLVVPREHIPSLAHAQGKHEGLLGRMMLLAPRLAKEMGCDYQGDENGNGSGGFRTQFNTGPDGGQEVYHLHLHVLGGKRP